MAESAPAKPPRLVLCWESLETWQQLAISVPVLSVLFFVLNVGAFNQPFLRSVFYGIFEGGVFAGVFAAVTRGERNRRS